MGSSTSRPSESFYGSSDYSFGPDGSFGLNPSRRNRPGDTSLRLFDNCGRPYPSFPHDRESYFHSVGLDLPAFRPPEPRIPSFSFEEADEFRPRNAPFSFRAADGLRPRHHFDIPFCDAETGWMKFGTTSSRAPGPSMNDPPYPARQQSNSPRDSEGCNSPQLSSFGSKLDGGLLGPFPVLDSSKTEILSNGVELPKLRGLGMTGILKMENDTHSAHLSHSVSLHDDGLLYNTDTRFGAMAKDRTWSAEISRGPAIHSDAGLLFSPCRAELAFKGRTFVGVESMRMGVPDIRRTNIAIQDEALMSKAKDWLNLDRVLLDARLSTHDGYGSGFDFRVLNLEMGGELEKRWRTGPRTPARDSWKPDSFKAPGKRSENPTEYLDLAVWAKGSSDLTTLQTGVALGKEWKKGSKTAVAANVDWKTRHVAVSGAHVENVAEYLDLAVQTAMSSDPRAKGRITVNARIRDK